MNCVELRRISGTLLLTISTLITAAAAAPTASAEPEYESVPTTATGGTVRVWADTSAGTVTQMSAPTPHDHDLLATLGDTLSSLQGWPMLITMLFAVTLLIDGPRRTTTTSKQEA